MVSYIGHLATQDVITTPKNFKMCDNLCQYWGDLNSEVDLLLPTGVRYQRS